VTDLKTRDDAMIHGFGTLADLATRAGLTPDDLRNLSTDEIMVMIRRQYVLSYMRGAGLQRGARILANTAVCTSRG